MKFVRCTKYFLLLFSLVFFSVSMGYADEKVKPFVLNEEPLPSDQLIQTAGDRLVYVHYDEDNSRLYSVKLNGTDKKYLTGVVPPDADPDDDEVPEEDAEKQILVLAQKKDHLSVVQEGADYFVYFQARPNRHTYPYYLYKANVNGSAYPTKLFELSEPGNSITKSADSKLFYISRESSHSIYDVVTGVETKLPFESFGAAPSGISPDFRYIIYVKIASTPSGQKYDLHAYDRLSEAANTADLTILPLMENFDVKLGFTPDSSKLVLQRRQNGRNTLETVSFNGSGLTQFFPASTDSTNYEFDFFKAVKGTRDRPNSVDKGVVLFIAKSLGSSAGTLKKYDLNDKMVTDVKVDQQPGETISDVRVTPDSKIIVYRRTAPGDRPQNYAYRFLDSAASPVFIFASDFNQSVFLEDSLHMVYLSSSTSSGEKNAIVKVSLDGQSSTPLSLNFETDWIKPTERITSIDFTKDYYVLTVADSQPNKGVTYSVRSFKR